MKPETSYKRLKIGLNVKYFYLFLTRNSLYNIIESLNATVKRPTMYLR